MNKIVQTIISLMTLFATLVWLANHAMAAKIGHPLDPAPPHPTRLDTSLARRLGWLNAPLEICGGYFVEPNLAAFGEPFLPPKKSMTRITADSATLSQRGIEVLSGHVIVVQSGRRLEADKALIYRNPKTGKIQTIDLYGNIHAYSPGKLIISDKAQLELGTQSGTLNNVVYRVLLVRENALSAHLEPIGRHNARLHGLTAWGQAKQALQTKPGHTEFRDASYTTCPPTSNQWRVIGQDLKLNKETGVGSARNVKLEIRGVPVLYMPYLKFPMDHRRQSGFLFPTIGFSNVSGAEFISPYYWNIAPNYDATLTPGVYSKRGIMLSGLFRYLTSSSSGSFRASFMPQDQAFRKFKNTASSQYAGQFGLQSLMKESSNRYYVGWRDLTHFNQHWTGHVDYNQVSDDYYFQDFGSIPALISTNQLPSEADVQYISDHWNFYALVSSFDSLHPVNRQPVANLYSRMPELDLTGHYPELFPGIDVAMQSQAVYFTRTFGPSDSGQPPQAMRLNIQPSVSLPFDRIWGYFIPTVQFSATQYGLRNQLKGRPSAIIRTLPIVDIDGGLLFDRHLSLDHHPFIQTLEPRIYYLYVPFQDQNAIPNFDSGIIPFSYNQLFRYNRFSGGDRIGDANQLSVSLSTRIIDQVTGLEKFRFSIGNIIYFRHRKVSLCNLPGCDDKLIGMGATSPTEDTSPIAGFASYHFSPAWSLNGNLAWDPNTNQSINSNAYIQYRPAPHYLFNVGYYYLRNGDIINTATPGSPRNNLNQVGVSYAMPIYREWSTVGLFNYNISQDHPQSFVFGLQYSTCCWAARLLGGRTFTALNENGKPKFNNGIYFQLVLKGLANIDPENVGTLLTSQITGYKDPFATMQTVI